MKGRLDQLNVRKVATFSIVANSLQILLIVCIVLYMLFSDSLHVDTTLMQALVTVDAFGVALGAVFDIRDALSVRKIVQQIDDMDATLGDLEKLNITLRAQRHDFLNHLQVVYSLMEMNETAEANAYIEKVYGQITAVSRALKTANPAINALLQVKLAACEKAHIQVDLQIQSAWKDLPMPGWEMCKVLGNLIDNAIDALGEVSERKLTIRLTEDLHAFRFAVSNNGPMIPQKSQVMVFDAGVTTKSDGHGMGLYIVRKVLRDRGGDVTLVSDATSTEFSGFVPKEIHAAAGA